MASVLNSEGAESENELLHERKTFKKKVEPVQHKSFVEQVSKTIVHIFKDVVRVPYHKLDQE